MPTVLFVISIYNYHREVQPVVEKCVRNGWVVLAVIGRLWNSRLVSESDTRLPASGAIRSHIESLIEESRNKSTVAWTH